MLAEESIRAGDPETALKQLQDQARQHPADVKYRIFLFQLLAVLGQWERARNQLKVAAELDPACVPMAQAYGLAINAEQFRAEVFAGRQAPVVFGEPEAWLAWLIEAVRLDGEGAHDQAHNLRERAFDQAPATTGTIDGQDFGWIADADPRLGPVLEAVLNGRYYWIPFARIRTLRIDAPADLRDLIWMPAYLTWANGGEAAALLPARYPGSETSADGGLRLARKTDWLARAGGDDVGLGQRMLATDADEYPLMEVREVQLNVQSPDDDSESAAHG